MLIIELNDLKIHQLMTRDSKINCFLKREQLYEIRTCNKIKTKTAAQLYCHIINIRPCLIYIQCKSFNFGGALPRFSI